MIYTFYSYKGGVGRSMAMANVAWELASRGLRVLAIDFDLEAPGLERYFGVPLAEVHATKGVIDLIDAFKRALSGSGSMADDAEFRRLPHYIRRGIVEYGRGARLDLMPAGRRATEDDKRAYALAVRTFDWQDFYFNWEGEAFFEWLRRTLIGPGEHQYDVVLADSRTGVTEMGGVCACQLADVVVMLCAPNHQNIEGTRELAADLNSPEVQRLRRNRTPLQIVVVPARVEQRLPELCADFEQRFDAAFAEYRPAAHVALGLAAHDLALPYVPEFAFEEQVTTERETAGQGLTARYRHLADALLVLAGDSVPEALRSAAQRALQPQGAGDAAPGVSVAFDPTKRSAGVDAYLSCARAARGQVRELLAALEASGQRLRSEFGEAEAFGNERDLPLTASEQLRHAQALVLFADAQGVRPWQRAELKLARSLPRVPVIVQVLLPGAAEDAFALAFGDSLRDCTLIDLRRWPDERSGAWLLAEALGRGGARPEEGLTSATAAAEPEADGASEGPFPGTAAYAEGDAAVFGGRTAQVEALRALAVSQRRLVLVGPAGAGKTSLVRAGLFPSLRGSLDIGALHCVDLRDADGDDGAWRPALDAAQRMPAGALVVLDHVDEAGDAALQAVAGCWQRDDGPRLLLVWREAPLAQAEAEALRRWGLEGVAASAKPEHALHQGCSFGGAAGALLALAAQAPRIALAPLEADSLRAATEAALAHAGRRAETGLLERLFADAGAAPSAAAVQRVLQLLWAQQLRGWLTNDAYDRAGGLDGLFVAELERQLGAAAAADRDALHSLLLRLMRRADDGSLQLRPFSWARSVTQPVLGGRAAALVQPLATAGLLGVQRRGEDLQVALAHKPRDWAGLDPLLEITVSWRAHVLQIAAAYQSWVEGGAGDEADDILELTDLRALAPSLSAGEAAFAARRQAANRRATRIRVLMRLGVLLIMVAGGTYGYLQSRSRDLAAAQAQAAQAEVALADATVAAVLTTRELAVSAARSQTEQAAVAPPEAAASKPPPVGVRVTYVAHRSGAGGNDGADARLAGQLLQQLPTAEFRPAGAIEQVAQTVCGDVRFHHDADRVAAQRAVDHLNRALAAAGDPRSLDTNDRSTTQAAQTVRPGTLEIWLPPLTDAPVQRQDRWGDSRLVGAGCALLGSDAKARYTLQRGLNAPALGWFETELPVQRPWLAGFYIGRTEVTMAAFAAYQRECEQTKPACPAWKPRFVDPQRDPRRPATFVSWTQARDYCRWAGGRLPTDREWEKAARGPEGRFWPWGDKPDDALFKGKSQGERRPVDVGSFPRGNSPYGVADMAGNVWEYTADTWVDGDPSHTIRGGSYLNTLMESRASVRWASGDEATGTEHLGFRCVAELMR